MQEHLNITQDLVAEGNYKEALGRFMWFHAHALEYDPGMYGIRLSIALVYWKNLGDIYPPALKALVKIRDDSEKLIQQGKGDKNLFHDVLSINRILKQQDKSIALFELIDNKDEKLADEYWPMIKDYILEKRRHDIAKKFIKDLTKEFAEVKEIYGRNTNLYNDPHVGGAEFKNYNENYFVDQIKELVDLARALEDEASAISVLDSAILVLDDQRLKDLIPGQ